MLPGGLYVGAGVSDGDGLALVVGAEAAVDFLPPPDVLLIMMITTTSAITPNSRLRSRCRFLVGSVAGGGVDGVGPLGGCVIRNSIVRLVKPTKPIFTRTGDQASCLWAPLALVK